MLLPCYNQLTPESKLLPFPAFYSVCLGFSFFTLQAGPGFVPCVVVVYQIWAPEMVSKARSCWWNPSAVIPGEFLVGVAQGQMDKCVYG